MEEPSDAELVEAYTRTGDVSVFDVLLRRHIRKVRAMIYAMVLNEADADELTQDVFLRVIGGIHGFGQRSSFSTWLHRIAMNTTYTFLKRRNRSPVEHREEPPDLSDPSRPAPPDILITREGDARLMDALGKLAPVLRSALTLTVLQGLSIREAARVEGCLSATMYWRVHQARKNLRLRLEEGVL